MKLLNRKDYAVLYTILERCRVVAEDPYLWRLRLVTELVDAFDCTTAYFGDHKIVGPYGSDGWLVPYSLVDFGRTTEQQRTAFWDWVNRGRPEQNPMVVKLMSPQLFNRKKLIAMLRARNVDDETWYASPFYQIYCQPAGLDDMLGASLRTESGEIYWLVLQRDFGKEPFNERERRLLALVTAVMIQEIGETLAPIKADSMLQLPRRERQILLKLLAGDNEKEIAAHLEISSHTVHQYIKRMYRKYNLGSRTDLLIRARCVSSVLSSTLLDDVPLDHSQSLEAAYKSWKRTFSARKTASPASGV